MTTITLADIAVDEYFYMDVGGNDDVLCRRISETMIEMQNVTKTAWVKTSYRPLWEVRKEPRPPPPEDGGYRPVAGHSSTWPYGEH